MCIRDSCYHEDGTWYRAVLDGRELELFDICDEKGEPTGEVMERGMVHHYGKMHRTAHIWIVNRMPDGSYQVLLQKRSKKKDSYPGCYDISSAGHIHAGDSYLPSARRELAEEQMCIRDRFQAFHTDRSAKCYGG